MRHAMEVVMRILLATMLLLPVLATPAAAAGQTLTVAFPTGFSAAPAGRGDLVLRVEDDRADKRLGSDVEGQSLRSSSDLAASLRAFVAADLTKAGFHVVPLNHGASRTLLIRIKSLRYSAKKTMFKTSAEVRAALLVDMPGKIASTYTFRSHVSDEYAWKPSLAQRGALIGEALAGAVSAAFGEPEIGKALAEQ